MLWLILNLVTAFTAFTDNSIKFQAWFISIDEKNYDYVILFSISKIHKTGLVGSFWDCIIIYICQIQNQSKEIQKT